MFVVSHVRHLRNKAAFCMLVLMAVSFSQVQAEELVSEKTNILVKESLTETTDEGLSTNDETEASTPPLTARSTQAKVPATSTEVASAAQLLKTVFGLIVVIAIIFVLAWLVRRYGNFSVSGQGQLKLVAGLNVGQKERVVIVQVGETQLLLGVAPGRVEKLHEIAAQDRVIINESENSSSVDFAARLKQAMKGRSS